MAIVVGQDLVTVLAARGRGRGVVAFTGREDGPRTSLATTTSCPESTHVSPGTWEQDPINVASHVGSQAMTAKKTAAMTMAVTCL